MLAHCLLASVTCWWVVLKLSTCHKLELADQLMGGFVHRCVTVLLQHSFTVKGTLSDLTVPVDINNCLMNICFAPFKGHPAVRNRRI